MKAEFASHVYGSISKSMVAKQLVLILLVSTLVIVTLLLNEYFIFRSTDTIGDIVVTKVNEITTNTRLIKELDHTFSQVHSYSMNFLNKEEDLELEENLNTNLQKAIQILPDKNQNLKLLIQSYQNDLSPLVKHCKETRELFLRMRLNQQNIATNLLQFDEFVVTKQLSNRYESREEEIAFNQFAIIIPALFEIFFELKAKGQLVTWNIIHESDNSEDAKSHIINLVDELQVGLQSISVSWKETQAVHSRLKTLMGTHRQSWRTLISHLEKFLILRKSLDYVEGQIHTELLKINQQISSYATLLQGETQKRTRLTFKITLFISISILLLLATITYLMLKVIIPVKELIAGVEKVSSGDMKSKVVIESKDEIGQLADAFNQMTENLQQTTMSRDTFENLINSLNELLIVTDLNGKILSANKATYRTLKFSERRLKNTSILDLLHLREKTVSDGFTINSAHDFYEATRKNYISNIEAYYSTQSGYDVPVLFSSAPVRSKSNQVEGIVCIATDISDRIHAEKRLSDTEHRYKELFNGDRTALIVIDAETKKIEDANCAALKLFGYTKEEFLQLDLFDISGEQEKTIDDFGALLANQKQAIVIPERILKKSDGTEFISEISPFTFESDGETKVVGVLRDLTEKLHLEMQLRQSQKMQAIGTLAGGIAHDFNNILSAIIGYTEIALEQCPPESAIHEDLQVVFDSGLRAKDLVRQILAFSRQADTERILIEPATITREVAKLLNSTIPATIKVSLKIDDQPGLLLANPTQIHQIVMNLCTNAYHAMEEHGGTLLIALKSVTSLPSNVLNTSTITPFGYVQISICDTGKGIPVEIQDRIFDPFFTTKEPNRGTGMGLSVVHGLVQSYDGVISVQSTLDKGTKIDVYLPAANPDTIKNNESSKEQLIGSEHILFVDDEDILGKMGKSMLEKLGYQVTVKMDGSAALETFKREPGRFDIVITDQTMPGMTGMELARHILQLKPGLPIILCTGYSSLVSEKQALEAGIRRFVYKPLSRNDLARLIRSSLQ